MRTVRSDSFRGRYEAVSEISDAERCLPALLRMLLPSSLRRRRLTRQPALPTIALSVLTVLQSTSALALDPSLDVSQYGHTAWTSRSGFLNGAVYAISQTPDGYLWLGTQSGAVRFDGVRAVPLALPPGQQLPSTVVEALLPARDGTLWIGTIDGLVSWKNGHLTQYPALAHHIVVALLQDRGGTVWVGGVVGPRGKLCAIRGESTTCHGDDGSLGSAVASLYEDSDGTLWVGTGTGLWRWNPGPPTRWPATPIRGHQALTQGDHGSGLMVATEGVRKIVGTKLVDYPLPGAPLHLTATNLLRDHNGGLWIGTSSHGLVHTYEGKTSLFNRNDGLSSDHVNALFEDREGTIWVATSDGLDQFRELPVTSLSVKQGLSRAAVTSVLAARDGSVWIGSADGLNKWNHGRVTIYRRRNDPGLPDDEIESLFEDEGGRIWVSAYRGLAVFENGKFTAVPSVPAGYKHSIAGDNHGGLWLSMWLPANDYGLAHLVDGKITERVPWQTIGGGPGSGLVPDPEGGVWTGLITGGIALFRAGHIQKLQVSNHVPDSSRVLNLSRDRDGTMWAATENGLSRIANGRVATLTTGNGLPCNAVHWIIEDDRSSYWLYTRCGLLRIARTELDAWTADPKRMVQVTAFDTADGIRLMERLMGFRPFVTKSSDGKIWFRNGETVSYFDPSHIGINTLPPPVRIEQIAANAKTYDAKRGLRLPPLVHDLTIDYTALSFTTPERVRFRYQLEGQDMDWREVVNKREVQYSNLPPGKYRFRVRASNDSRVWNEAGDFLEFSVAPAYYQTNWFRLLCAATLLTMIWSFYHLRVRSLERRHAETRALNEALRRSESYLAEGQRLSHTGSWAFDVACNAYIYLSDECIRMFGLDPKAALPTREAIFRLIHPEDSERVDRDFRNTVDEKVDTSSEFRIALPKGTMRHIQTTRHPVSNDRGEVFAVVGTVIDITERKRAEEEREKMRQLEADLAHIGRVSTLGELAASIAHEVNQPLAGVVSNASAGLRWLAADVPNLDEAREGLRRIVRDGKRAGEVIQRIRALTKKTETAREKLDLNRIIGEVLALVGDEAKKSRVVVRTEFVDDLSPVFGDPIQLQQVVLNLIMNAIEAMSSLGERKRELAITTRHIGPNQVQVTVQDSGVGIEPEKMVKIFDSFYTTKPGGMGLGLSISRSILQGHGGRLWATANNGPGTSFHFTLPKHHEVKADAGAAEG